LCSFPSNQQSDKGIAVIELAPGHKLGFVVANPILLAAGIIGMGEATTSEMGLAELGAVVIGPLRRGGQAGLPTPRLAEMSGGVVLNGSEQNRALSAVLRRFARLWPRLGCPVVIQLADRDPQQLAATAEQLSTVAGVSAFELLVPEWADAAWVSQAVAGIARVAELPLWVKVPLANAAPIAVAAQLAGAAGIVIGQPLAAAAARLVVDNVMVTDGAMGSRPIKAPIVQGQLFGPLTFAPMLAALLAIQPLDLGMALIPCGGIHTLAQARHALAAGAVALQIDSAAWIEPGLPITLARELGG